MKTYILKAFELDQMFIDARKHDKEGCAVKGLDISSCLITDEIGRCIFDRENTRLFFYIIDRRYAKN